MTIPRGYALIAALLLAGCATTQGQSQRTPGDPLEGMNRGIYKFNDALDRAALKPTAKGYKKITPDWMERGISNFFTNLEQPVVLVNNLLQGKPADALMDTGRLVFNTVFGIGGLFDPASANDMPLHDEDFGQTLGIWGVRSGPYLTLPFLGPSSLRDAPSRVADYFLGPLRYVDMKPGAEWGLRGLEVVDSRAGLLSLDATLESAHDPYAFVRDAWQQRREFLVKDGEVPEESAEIEVEQ